MKGIISTCVNIDTIIKGTVSSNGPELIISQICMGFILPLGPSYQNGENLSNKLAAEDLCRLCLSRQGMQLPFYPVLLYSPYKASDLSYDTIAAIAKHFAKKKIGWFSKYLFKDVQLPNNAKKLLENHKSSKNSMSPNN